MNARNDGCRQCGKCCHLEVSLTLLDIHRLAILRDMADHQIFADLVDPEKTNHAKLLVMRRQSDGACRFLQADNRCAVEEAKPNACRLYNCRYGEAVDSMPWTAFYETPASQIQLWSHSFAAAVTTAYLNKNGSHWHRADYRRAIDSIYRNTLPEQPFVQAGDCSEKTAHGCLNCDADGQMSMQPLVTLDDVQRLAEVSGIGLADFFTDFVDPVPSPDGLLQLKRLGSCAFFDDGICRAGEGQPMHCRSLPRTARHYSPTLLRHFYLGSGTVQEQFRHQVSVELTRSYVAEAGSTYDRDSFRRLLGKIEWLSSDQEELEKFRDRVSAFRYHPETDTELPPLAFNA
jgi:Fe-S-cluster containining protein